MFAHINNVHLYYEVTGKGEPVLFLHGNGSSGKGFHSARDEFQKHFTVYLLDSRDHGRSQRNLPLHYEDMADDAAEFVRQIIGKPATIVGHSDGGIIGLIMAMKHPDTVEELFALGANSSPEGLKKAFTVPTKLNYLRTKSPFAKMMLDEPHLSRHDMSEIKIPVHVIAGVADVIKRSDSEFIAESIPGATLTILPGEGHSTYVGKGRKLFGICKKLSKSPLNFGEDMI